MLKDAVVEIEGIGEYTYKKHDKDLERKNQGSGSREHKVKYLLKPWKGKPMMGGREKGRDGTR